VISHANGGPGLPAKRSKALGKSSKIRWESSKSVAENAKEKLPELARYFFESGRELAQLETQFSSLHRFRLLAKRFRYTLELFRPCYGPGLVQRIEALRTLQQFLGEINDCSATRDLVLERDDLPRPDRDRLLHRLEELTAARVAAFRSHWEVNYAQLGKELWWINYLSRFAKY
jgi:CHAD domain-containing protein